MQRPTHSRRLEALTTCLVLVACGDGSSRPAATTGTGGSTTSSGGAHATGGDGATAGGASASGGARATGGSGSTAGGTGSGGAPGDGGTAAGAGGGSATGAAGPGGGTASGGTGADASTSPDGAAPSWVPPAPTLDAPGHAAFVTLVNERGEPFYALLAEPDAAGPHPAIVVLHGSGGLMRMPGANDTGTCSDRMESQFTRWAQRLLSLGFVVLMPDSFGPRGFCDFNDDPRKGEAFPPIAADTDGQTRRLVARIYDADTSLRFLATHASVDANRMALLGFSNGASVVMVSVHHRLPDALDEFAANADGQALGVPMPPLPRPSVPVQQAIAYYPGCGFDGLLPLGTDPADLATFYYPAAPLRIEHGSLDSLVEHCSVTATGTRELQADAYAAGMSLPDHYDVVVHDGASHGFDAAGCELPDAGADADTVACRDALASTLSLLGPLRAP